MKSGPATVGAWPRAVIQRSGRFLLPDSRKTGLLQSTPAVLQLRLLSTSSSVEVARWSTCPLSAPNHNVRIRSTAHRLIARFRLRHNALVQFLKLLLQTLQVGDQPDRGLLAVHAVVSSNHCECRVQTIRSARCSGDFPGRRPPVRIAKDYPNYLSQSLPDGRNSPGLGHFDFGCS